MNLDQKLEVMRVSKAIMNRYIFDRSVVLATHDEKTITDHGSGILLRIENQPVVITAAHVIKDASPKNIQVIATHEPSNYRFAPVAGNFLGGEVNEDLDVGFLYIAPSALPLLAGKQFLSLDDLDLVPNDLSADLAILFGMPATERREPTKNVHSFGSFTFMTNFPSNLNWTAPQNRPTIIPVEYDKVVEDVFTGQHLELPRPNGMSGGGLWRARFKGASIWTPERLRLVGILTEFDSSTREVLANPVQNIYQLLAQHFSLPRVIGA